MLNHAKAIQDQIVHWRRTIHKNPELGFEETQTANLIAENLRSFGLKVQTGVARTGVLGILGEGKPAIGLRADMDALPLQEANQTEYTSQVPNKMHACGHDSHVAMLLGAAKLLSEMPDRPQGEIRFLFQPSEERWDADGISGGSLMVKEGLIDGLDHVFAIHINSLIPPGKIVSGTGYVMAAPDQFVATITGKGTHGAYPHMGVDPIFALAQVINAIHGIRARRINPLKPSVISIGAVHSGDANNIIPNSVFFNGTIRSYDEEIRQQLHEELERALGVARALGCQTELKIERGYPATYNDPQFTAQVERTAKSVLGDDCLYPFEPSMGGEDFSYMSNEKPGTLVWLGAKLDGEPRPHHNPYFDIDENALPMGTALYAQVAVDTLKNKS
ncbi:MAG: M20 family metallopeptidase [Chloroflexi bacterium]|nr:M20 family metallopeptidase [Chloroflexota bacterium]